MNTVKADCPHCSKPVEIEFEIPKADKAKNVTVETGNNTVQTIIEKVQTDLNKPEPPKAKLVEKVPSHIPAFKCKNCGDNHKNKNYSARPKGKCTNCGQFAKDDKGTCPWCDKEVEPIEEDELEDLGIPKPEPHEHEEEE